MGMAKALKQSIVEEAKALGFDAVRFASADAVKGAGPALDRFLAEGRQGDMAWLARTAERRKSPRALWGEARSVILLGLNYGRSGDPLAILSERSRAAISIYAQGDDYHDVLKAKLKPLAARVQALTQGDVKIFVDTAPVMEKPLAARAGLGWQGKHTNLVSREFGSWLFIGSIFTSAEMPSLSRCLSHRRLHGALPDRCASVHFLSHHRAQGPHRAALPQGDGQSHLWLRRLSCGLSLEQIRQCSARGEAQSQGRVRQPSPRRASHAR